jgi:hypothetical protein
MLEALACTSQPVRPVRHHLYAGKPGPPETTLWEHDSLDDFLQECTYVPIAAWGAHIDDPRMGREAVVQLYGNAAGHFCLTIDYGTPGVPPAVIEAGDTLNLARAVAELTPLLKLMGIMR